MKDFENITELNEYYQKQFKGIWYDADKPLKQNLKEYLESCLIGSALVFSILLVATLFMALASGGAATPLMSVLGWLNIKALSSLYLSVASWEAVALNIAFCAAIPLVGLIALKLVLSTLRTLLLPAFLLSDLARYWVKKNSPEEKLTVLKVVGATFYYPIYYSAYVLDALFEHSFIKAKMKDTWRQYLNSALVLSIVLVVTASVLGCLAQSLLLITLSWCHAYPLMHSLFALHPAALFGLDLLFASVMPFIVVPALGLIFTGIHSIAELGRNLIDPPSKAGLNNSKDKKPLQTHEVKDHLISKVKWVILSCIKHILKSIELLAQSLEEVLQVIGLLGTLIVKSIQNALGILEDKHPLERRDTASSKVSDIEASVEQYLGKFKGIIQVLGRYKTNPSMITKNLYVIEGYYNYMKIYQDLGSKLMQHLHQQGQLLAPINEFNRKLLQGSPQSEYDKNVLDQHQRLQQYEKNKNTQIAESEKLLLKNAIAAHPTLFLLTLESFINRAKDLIVESDMSDKIKALVEEVVTSELKKAQHSGILAERPQYCTHPLPPKNDDERQALLELYDNQGELKPSQTSIL